MSLTCYSIPQYSPLFVTAVPRTVSGCKAPISRGTCSNALSMYAFDSRLKRCVSFTYSGCGGNANLFFTMRECKNTCGPLIKDNKNKNK